MHRAKGRRGWGRGGGEERRGAFWSKAEWSVGQVQNKIMALNFHVNYKRRQPAATNARNTAEEKKARQWLCWVDRGVSRGGGEVKAKKLAIINDWPPTPGPRTWPRRRKQVSKASGAFAITTKRRQELATKRAKEKKIKYIAYFFGHIFL